MEGVGGRGFEAEPVVELIGFLVCVGHDGAHSHGLGHGGTTQQCVLKEGPADAAVLVPAVNRESGEHQNRHGLLLGLPLQQSLCCVFGSHLADCERVVADHLFVAAGDEGARRSGGLGVSCVPVEPVVQRIFLAAEIAEVVLAP